MTIGKFVLHNRKLLTLLAVSTPMALVTSCLVETLPIPADIPSDSRDFDTLLDVYTGTRRVFGSDAKILTNGPESYEAIVELIRSAKDHINVQTLNFDSDDDRSERLGLDIARLLADKARQGVRVNVIIDAVFQRYISRPVALGILEKGGVRVRSFVPPWYKILAGHMLYRTHKKMFIVDGTRAIVGGSNLGTRYLAADAWRDTNVLLTGPVVGSVQGNFLRDWKSLGERVEDDGRFFPPLAATGGEGIRVIDQRPKHGDFDINRAVVIALRGAQARVDIQTPYFNPPGWLAEELVRAARRGVRVRVLTNSERSSNMIALYWSGAYHFDGYIRRGIELYLWDRVQRAIHSKVFVVDDRLAMVGSYNFSHRSARWDAENAVIFTDFNMVRRVRAMAEHDLGREYVMRVDSKWTARQGRREQTLWGLTQLVGWMM